MNFMVLAKRKRACARICTQDTKVYVVGYTSKHIVKSFRDRSPGLKFLIMPGGKQVYEEERFEIEKLYVT